MAGALVRNRVSTPCEFLDISMSGCSLRLGTAFTAGALAEVEVVLTIAGMVLEIGGTVQWVREGNTVGVRFHRASAKAKNDLAALLTCLIDESATGTVVEAVTAAEGRKETEVLSVRVPDSKEPEPESAGVENGPELVGERSESEK
jgi:hypothetical protein